MPNYRVSVIVPVYNVERYIKRCAISLFKQTYDNIEFIFINDCSKDNSVKVLENLIQEFPEIQDRISIINHSSNEGISATRNSGLNAASGDYLIQVDSDDWIEHDMIKSMLQKARTENADLVWADYYVDKVEGVVKREYISQKGPNSYEDLTKMILSGKAHSASWNKMIRTEVFKLNKIFFPKEINICEDVVFFTTFLQHCRNISYLPKAFYHYVQHPNSITNSIDRKSFQEESKVINVLQTNLDLTTYGESILLYKARLKRKIFLSNLFSDKEFKMCFPEADRILHTGERMFSKIIFWLAVRGYSNVARRILKLGKKLAANKRRIRDAEPTFYINSIF